jgi:fluoride exporter
VAQPADDDWPPAAAAQRADADELRPLPVDPDVETDVDTSQDTQRRHDTQEGFEHPARRRWPRIHWAIVAAVFGGGFFGGLTRYCLGLAWPAPKGSFPWAVWTVNTSGAFILGLVLVVVLEVLPPTTYVRAVLATGFCGALTTFSSVATDADQLAAHGHAALAGGYVAGSLAAGLAAGSFGMTVGRSFATYREKGRE